MKTKKKKYSLTDCYKMNESYPDTFQLPTDVEIANLKIGDCVKLIFFDEKERMWVQITEKFGDKFTGTLNSYPVSVDLKFNDVIHFRTKHICQTYIS